MSRYVHHVLRDTKETSFRCPEISWVRFQAEKWFASLLSRFFHIFILLLIRRHQETLRRLVRKVRMLPEQTLLIYLSQFFFLFYRVQLALIMFKEMLTLFMIPTFVLNILCSEVACIPACYEPASIMFDSTSSSS